MNAVSGYFIVLSLVFCPSLQQNTSRAGNGQSTLFQPNELKSVNPIQDIGFVSLNTGVICRAKCFLSCQNYKVKVLNETTPSMARVIGKAVVFTDVGVAAVLCEVTAKFLGQEYSKWIVQVVKVTNKRLVNSKENLPLYKLSDSTKPNEGNLMVLVENNYHYNCFTNTTRETLNAKVVCREMGFPDLDEFVSDGRFKPQSLVNSLVHFYYQCAGSENNLDDCDTWNRRRKWRNPCGKAYRITGLICKPAISVSLPAYKLKIENEFFNPQLSIEYSRAMPELGEPVTITCFADIGFDDRQVIRMYRNYGNGEKLYLSDSVMTDLSATIQTRDKTIRLAYSYTYEPQDPSDTFECTVIDLETAATKTAKKSLKYKTPLTNVDIKMFKMGPGNEPRDITPYRNLYGQVSYLLCDVGKDVFPLPSFSWTLYLKSGKQIVVNESQKLLLNNTIETRMPICCTAVDKISNKFVKSCGVASDLVDANNTVPLQQLKVCEQTSGKVSCEDSKDLYITKCVLSEPPSCSVDDYDECHSHNICSFIKEERCANNECILKDLMFQKSYIKDLMKKYIPKTCFRGKFRNIQIQYYCLPK